MFISIFEFKFYIPIFLFKIFKFLIKFNEYLNFIFYRLNFLIGYAVGGASLALFFWLQTSATDPSLVE
jgi:hypothetical protein